MNEETPSDKRCKVCRKWTLGGWESARDVTAVIASILVLMGGLISIGAWVQFYFADQQAVKDANCRNSYETKLLSLQMRANNAYARYINAKVSKWEAETRTVDEKDSEQRIRDIAVQNERMERAWTELESNREEGDDLTELFESGQLCPSKGGVLWPAS